MVEIVPLEDEDMVEISSWFVDRKWRVAPQGNVLPETGYVARDGDRLLAVAWLYLTNSTIAMVDWIATNPREGTAGILAVKKLLRHLEGITKAGGYNVFMHFTPNDKLARYLHKKCGWKTTERGVNICIRNRPMEEAAHG